MIKLIIGGAISLVSAVIIIIVQHFLEMHKKRLQIRDYPMTVVYNKQVEFVETIIPLLRQLNEYITNIDVWLAEGTSEGEQNALKNAEKNNIVMQFYDIIEKYEPFLPSSVIGCANSLFEECFFLSKSPTLKKTSHCINMLFDFQNGLRTFMGVDRLSEDLLKAIRQRKRKESN